ncbi:hypothetical protein [Mycoplasma sp. CSL7503-lung]|uniref:hypothetical protein n=1 Tax=Mycoplasma sp. CSL7503-lung TaxID=536372 RepID=UPI0021D0C456|nr:hypothetical protein [Mycoplasma sp. CSL7503-lung]MCU4706369.1 hypothetical protein [Mycoplasma sp. CSL7503-lung]
MFNQNWNEKYKNIKTTDELWKHEKKDFRIYFILYTLAITLLSLIWFSWFIILLVSKEQYLLLISESIKNNKQLGEPIAYYNSELIQQTFYTISLIAMNVSYIMSVFKSYKNKNFKHISSWVQLIYYGLAIWKIIGFIVSITQNAFATIGNNYLSIISLIFNILSLVIFMVIIFFLHGKLNKIQRAFKYIEYVKTMEEYQKAFMENIRSNNPFGPSSFNATNSSEEERNSNNRNSHSKDDYTNSENYKKIIELPREQLNDIAKKLNIFGYEDMEKEELAKLIYNITKK